MKGHFLRSSRGRLKPRASLFAKSIKTSRCSNHPGFKSAFAKLCAGVRQERLPHLGYRRCPHGAFAWGLTPEVRQPSPIARRGLLDNSITLPTLAEQLMLGACPRSLPQSRHEQLGWPTVRICSTSPSVVAGVPKRPVCIDCVTCPAKNQRAKEPPQGKNTEMFHQTLACPLPFSPRSRKMWPRPGCLASTTGPPT